MQDCCCGGVPEGCLSVTKQRNEPEFFVLNTRDSGHCTEQRRRGRAAMGRRRSSAAVLLLATAAPAHALLVPAVLPQQQQQQRLPSLAQHLQSQQHRCRLHCIRRLARASRGPEFDYDDDDASDNAAPTTRPYSDSSPTSSGVLDQGFAQVRLAMLVPVSIRLKNIMIRQP
jgi:hypothetical protein